jgi:SsrA-binding protein
VAAKGEERKTLLRNRKARHDYAIDETLETGVVLVGSEVKSLRAGNGSLTDSFADVRGSELFLVGAKIDPYPFANLLNHEPIRDRKLLAHRQEIKRLATKVREKGYTLVALEVYLNKGKIKVEIGLARGKKQYEKREATRAKDVRRELQED